MARNIEKSSSKWEIDLNTIFNRIYRGKSASYKRQIRPLISDPTIKRIFGERVIEKINDRTLDGIDRNDVNFAPYSSSYVNSKTFKLYGKEESEVNLKLTGGMLASMQSKNNRSTMITINFKYVGEARKAYYHIRGVPKKKIPKRDFFGLPKEELDKILSDIIKKESKSRFEQTVVDEFFKGFNI